MKNRFIIFVLFSFVIVSPIISGTEPYFVNVQSGETFNLIEHQLFTFFVEGKDNEHQYPLNFTYGNDVGSLISFDFQSYNETYGIINFTPGCTEIGNNPIKLIVQDNTTVEASVITAFFNVTNTNDPPNITSYNPIPLKFNISEGNLTGYLFNFTATDPDIPYGDSLNQYWFLDNKLNSTGLEYRLQTGFCEPKNITLKLYVNDSYGLSDFVLWELNITNVNRNPTFNFSNPIKNLTWPEDNYLIDNFSLVPNYFDDLDYYCQNRKDNLSFFVSGNTNITVNISKSWPYSVSFYPSPNFFGVNSVNITMSDGKVNVSSNIFILNVTPVPDYPRIEPIPDQETWAYANFFYKVNASDPDGGILTFSDNTSLFDVQQNGIINFTPSFSDAGLHNILINVTDITDLSNSTTMKLTIYQNHAPFLYPIANQSTGMENDFHIQVNASDSDGDNVNISILDSRFTKTGFNGNSANFTFSPDTNGTIDVKIIAYDIHNAYNTTNFFLNVTYFNFPPHIDSISSPQIVKIGEEYDYNVIANDGNGGKESLTYLDNTSLFDIQQNGLINFTASPSDAGNYSVNITVCDDGNPVKCSSVFVTYFVTNNRPPIIINPGNFTIFEDKAFSLLINASDPDNDPITFFDNASFFNIQQDGWINFTPNNTVSGKNYSIQINVSDVDNLTSSMTFQLNIEGVNDPPYFNPNLTDMPIWNNIYEDNLTIIFINATDEEHQPINFSLNFLNGSSIFNLTVVNASEGKAMINFTPINSQVGNYTIMINISDGVNMVSQNVTFLVHNVDDPPTILMIYPTGRFVSQFTYFNWSNASDSRYAHKTCGINVSEGESILFNQTSFDVDDVNLTYKWYFNGILYGNSTFLNYSFGYDSPREAIITINVSDPFGLSDAFHWDTSIKDVNRAPIFGYRFDNTKESLKSGIFNNTFLDSFGSIQLIPSFDNYSKGTFISKVIDMKAEERLDILNFVSKYSTPPGTSIKIFTATSQNKNDLKNWSIGYSSKNFTVSSPSKRYFRYKVLLTTINNSKTPSFQGGFVTYKIPDATIKNNNVFSSFVDLDKYFYDFDTDDSLTFSYSGASHMKVSIDDAHNVRIEPDGSYVGKDYLTFFASDGSNETSSNQIIFDILPGPGSSTSSSSSSSSTSVVYQTQIQKQKETVYSAFNLLAPKTTTVYKNDTVAVPITLTNTGNKTLYEISLTANSENKEINFTFSKDKFTELFPGDEDNTTLFATPYKIAGTYEIVVRAHVDDPDINDSVKIMVNSREKGEKNSSQINTKIAFTQDLLSSNPACYELNEVLDKARQSYANKQYGKAELYIEKALSDCKFLVSNANITTETPKPTNNLSSKQSTIYSVIISLTVIMILGLFLLYKKT